MKVLHVSYGHYPGYAAPYEYTQCLAAEGVEVHVIALNFPQWRRTR